MTIAIALLTLLAGAVAGLAVGLSSGRSRGRTEGVAEAEARIAAAAVADETRLRELAAVAIADGQQRLAEFNATQQQEMARQAAEAAARQERTVSDLVDPIDRKLKELNDALTQIERERAKETGRLGEALGNLTELTTSLGRETRTLATAMKDNKARGVWGEMQLRRVVELAGMIEYCDFVTQTTVDGDNGRLRPDLVVQLPQSRAIVVDSKVPMSAYLDAVNTEDTTQRKALLDQHTRDVLGHVNELQRRDYSGYVAGALDFVVMFVPGDTFLDAAFESRASWFEESIAKGVFPASPGTLVALLRAISYGWRQEQLAESADEIAALGRELHQRIGTMADKFAGVGRALGSATKAYNETVASLESRVLVTTRKLEERGIRSGRDLPEATPVEAVVRSLAAPELQESDTDRSQQPALPADGTD